MNSGRGGGARDRPRRGDETLARLPGGVWRDGSRDQEAWLRPLTGKDQRFVVDRCRSGSAAARTTALLCRVVTSLGGAPPDPDAIRKLTAGDREALLLELRRRTLGDRIDCVLACPECSELMDVPLNAKDLLVGSYAECRERYDTTFIADDAEVHVSFRLPTGGDQEAVAAMASNDLPGAACLLLRRCIDEIHLDSRPTRDLPQMVISHLADAMGRLDPQAEVLLALRCPACGAETSALFDAGTYFMAELSGRGWTLDHEVHLIALHYHWSESDILRLTPRRRHTYLDLLGETVGVRVGVT
jgi:hypothetical protein